MRKLVFSAMALAMTVALVGCSDTTTTTTKTTTTAPAMMPATTAVVTTKTEVKEEKPKDAK